MCLSTVTKIYKNPDNPRKNMGYVILRKGKKGFFPWVINIRKAYKIGEWRDSNRTKRCLDSDYKTEYELGFHIWKTLKAATAWSVGNDDDEVIAKVEFKDVVALGIQNHNKVIVARKRKIIKIYD